jgi:hypothetical protein
VFWNFLEDLAGSLKTFGGLAADNPPRVEPIKHHLSNRNGEQMKATRRIKITVETHRLLMARRSGRLLEGWCEQCSKQVAILLLEEAIQAGLSRETIARKVEEASCHFATTADDLTSICLNSLLE